MMARMVITTDYDIAMHEMNTMLANSDEITLDIEWCPSM
jgi:hypothetical protein